MLSFTLERHGGTVMGSSRADVQRWEVNMAERTAVPSSQGYRQLDRRRPPLKVEPIAAEIAEMISSGKDDTKLKWTADRKQVRVLIGRIIPDDAPQQTVQGRRKRFRNALKKLLESKGWDEISANKYQRRTP